MASRPNTSQTLRNLGPASWKMLADCGITDVQTIRRLGAPAAYLRVKTASANISLNLLYALAGGLEDRDWRSLSADEKARLNREFEDLQEIADLE